MGRRFAYILCLVLVLLVCGCATTPLVLLDFRPGAAVETLSSEVAISMHSPERSMAGRGYLVFRKPDQLHLVVLSPFGTTVMEIFALGDGITLVYPSQMTAYAGRIDELPDKGGLQGWRMMRWVMDAEPSGDTSLNGTFQRKGKLGFLEKVTFENGLLTAKESPDGEQVFYEGYKVVNGVPVATIVEMRNPREERVRLKLDEPEVNTPLEGAALMPHLENYRILPLSAMQGM